MSPKYKMKTVVRYMDSCINGNNQYKCKICPYSAYPMCTDRLMIDGLYYLKMTLEKSTKNEQFQKGK